MAEDINWTIQENWLYLEPYYQDLQHLKVPEQVLAALYHLVDSTPGIPLAELRKALQQTQITPSSSVLSSGQMADFVYIAIAQGLLYVDLSMYRLNDQNMRPVPVYRDQQIALANPILTKEDDELCPDAHPIILAPETPVTYDGKMWWIKLVGKTEITLIGEEGEPTTLPQKVFEKYVKEGKITGVEYQTRSSLTEEGAERLEEASPTALEIAEARQQILYPEDYLDEKHSQIALKQKTRSARTIRRWKQQFLQAEITQGSGFVGLLPEHHKSGRPRIASEDLALVEQAMESHYDTVARAPKRGAYGAYLHLCEQQHREPIHQSTFYGYFQHHKEKYDQVLVREGERAAYPFKDYHHPSERKRDPKGQSAWQESDIDHKLIDLVLCDSEPGSQVVLGKCWLTMLVLRHPHRLAAYALSFDPPSYRSCLMVLRLCVKRHGRLPESITVDGGPEFSSIYFEEFLAVYKIRKRRRPKSEPRYGAVQERLGLTMDTEFVDHLLGNTQATKDPRKVTRETDPRRLSAWTLPEFARQVHHWADTIYDNREHPALKGLSPRQAYEQSIERDGARQHKIIPYDNVFLMLTFPSTRTRKAMIQAGSGVCINYIDYWCEAMRTHIGETVPVRYDPFNRYIAYAYIKKRWRKCKSALQEFEGCSERELQLIAEEVRQREKVLHGREKVEIKQKDLALFRQQAGAAQKRLQEQRRKDRETKRAYALLEGGEQAMSTMEHPLPPEHSEKEETSASSAESIKARTPQKQPPPDLEPPDRSKLLVFRRQRV